MEVLWKVHCDVIVEEFHPRTGARQSQWTIKQSRIILEDEAVRRTRTCNTRSARSAYVHCR
jgi:hypothetical protein